MYFTLRPPRLGHEFFDRFGEDLICKGLTPLEQFSIERSERRLIRPELLPGVFGSLGFLDALGRNIESATLPFGFAERKVSTSNAMIHKWERTTYSRRYLRNHNWIEKYSEAVNQ